jgi:ribosomal protein L19E
MNFLLPIRAFDENLGQSVLQIEVGLKIAKKENRRLEKQEWTKKSRAQRREIRTMASSWQIWSQ